eukprot:Plantae.Rhodophyta-Palmaria_palmata.ctg11064.p1 GENE.Plantae.Rhodophyta-Palmaria_palmata.ctg11064~~Plantae.Rhodophyta-Palmaria_palmata.ctg11064.p1  ORF type:complete len:464 (-),score=124.76 Plantae.Rhodophyta-Palmaria_palmata.ctg11064:23-1372(-)
MQRLWMILDEPPAKVEAPIVEMVTPSNRGAFDTTVKEKDILEPKEGENETSAKSGAEKKENGKPKTVKVDENTPEDEIMKILERIQEDFGELTAFDKKKKSDKISKTGKTADGGNIKYVKNSKGETDEDDGKDAKDVDDYGKLLKRFMGEEVEEESVGKNKKYMYKTTKAHDDLAKILSEELAKLTPGFSAADCANVCNEAALAAAREDAEVVSKGYFMEAIERVIGGMKRKNKVMTLVEKETIAFHEAGKTIVGWFLKHCDPLLKVSIVPRSGKNIGFSQYDTKDRYLQTKEQMFHKMCHLLGGRAAEEVHYGVSSSACEDDLRKVTKMAYHSMSVYGMNDTFGTLSFQEEGGWGNPGHKPLYSDKTKELLDNEARKMVDRAYTEALNIVQEHKEGLEALARRLIDKEVILFEDVQEIVGERPFKTIEEEEEESRFDELIQDDLLKNQ